MSKRCAHCGEFNPRRSLQPPGEWVDYLVKQGASEPVGTVVIPLCRQCYADARDFEDLSSAREFLDEVDHGTLVDEVSG